MEKLQGPINPCFFEENVEVGCLEDQENGACYGQFVSNTGSYRYEYPSSTEEAAGETHNTLPSLEDKMPFLQMLESVEELNPEIPLMQQPNFQLLLRLQHQKMKQFDQRISCCYFNGTELESCLTNQHNEVMDFHSPVKSEAQIPEPQQTHHCFTFTEGLSPRCDEPQNCRAQCRYKRTHLPKSSCLVGVVPPKERRKRKRSIRPTKNKEEVESQRMTHIAVERNRRRQMNEHLNALRSLMPPSYIQRGDQASIIGGAIDFVKELEQLLQSLQAHKAIRHCEESGDVSATTSFASSSNLLSHLFMASSSTSSTSSSSSLSSTSNQLQFTNPHSHQEMNGNGNGISAAEVGKSSDRSDLADIEVVVIQNHVNLKIQCQRTPGQLPKTIIALEDLRLTVLHLNITSLHSSVLYSFNLKIEEDCKLRSADEVARAVHQIIQLDHHQLNLIKEVNY